MPFFQVEVTEVVRYRYWVQAPNRALIEAMDTNEFADACSANEGFMEVSERDVTHIWPPQEAWPEGEQVFVAGCMQCEKALELCTCEVV